jgi:hypothetical protein
MSHIKMENENFWGIENLNFALMFLIKFFEIVKALRE